MKITLQRQTNSLIFRTNLCAIVLLFLSTSIFYAQNTSSYSGKESIRQANGITSKIATKNNFKSLPDIYNNITNRTNACSPETSLIITEGTTWGISRSTINNNGIPSFCLSLGQDAPGENDIYFTTLTPATDINFGNSTLSKNTIINKVQRVLSVLNHNSFAPSNTPSNLINNFYKSISVVVWHYTNNLDLSNQNYSWTGADGNTYATNNLKQWVENGTLQASDALWLLPQDSSKQPEVILNENTSSNCCPNSPSLSLSAVNPTNNDGLIKIDSSNSTLYYGVSSLNAGSYDGPTTIATATELPNTLPTTIVSNVSNTGGNYIIRAFTNLDGCFTDYTVTVSGQPGACTSTYASYQSDVNNVLVSIM